MPIQESYQLMLNVLNEAKDKLMLITDSQVVNVRNRILTPINQEISSMSVMLGYPVQGDTQRITNTKPGILPTKIFGRTITGSQKKEPSVAEAVAVRQTDQMIKDNQKHTASQAEADALALRRDKLYDIFMDTENDLLLDKNDDLVIRAVAIKAGLPFTETNPEHINTKAIDMIKEAMRKKEALEIAKTPAAALSTPPKVEDAGKDK